MARGAGKWAHDTIPQAGKSLRLNKRIQLLLFVSLVAFCWVSRRTGAQLDLTEANEGNEARALRAERKTGQRPGECAIRTRRECKQPSRTDWAKNSVTHPRKVTDQGQCMVAAKWLTESD